MNGFTNKQAAKKTGLRPATIAFYSNEGIIIPGIENPKGKGTKRRYSKRNLVELLLVKKLVSVGIKLDDAKKAVQVFSLALSEGHLDFDGLDPDDAKATTRQLYLCIGRDEGGLYTNILWPDYHANLVVPMNGVASANIVHVTPIINAVRDI